MTAIPALVFLARTVRRRLVAVTIVVCAPVAEAQDFGAGYGMSLGAGAMNTMMGNLPLAAVQQHAERHSRDSSPVVARSMRYPATPAIARESQTAFLERLARQVAAMFRTKFGTDMHALALTDHGFEARG